jgi:hypothetical protein
MDRCKTIANIVDETTQQGNTIVSWRAPGRRYFGIVVRESFFARFCAIGFPRKRTIGFVSGQNKILQNNSDIPDSSLIVNRRKKVPWFGAQGIESDV